MIWVRAAAFVVLFPGTLLFYLPLWLGWRATAFVSVGPLRFLGPVLVLLGSAVSLSCVRDFVVRGRGTPAPVDPPKELVVAGLYRYVRNPMYWGGVVILLGHFLWFGATVLLLYAVLVFAGFHLFVVLYEEPALARRFGASYAAYRARVPRWLPRRPGN